ITSPLLVLCNLQLRDAYVADSGSRFGFATYQNLRIASLVLGLLLVMIICLAGGRSRSGIATVLVMYISKAIENVSDMRYAVFQKAGLIKQIGISLLIRTAVFVPVFCGVLVATSNLVIALLSGAAGNLVVLGLFDIPKSRSYLLTTSAPPTAF